MSEAEPENGYRKALLHWAPESCIYTDIQIFTKNRSTGAELWVGSGAN